jgi:hypothetical protein
MSRHPNVCVFVRPVGALLLSLVASSGLASAAAARTIYQESYDQESFPMTPEIDVLGLGTFNAGTGGQGPPPVPVPTGTAAFVTATSTGGGLPDEIPGTGTAADPLLALGIPYLVGGRFENFRVTASRSDPSGILGVGFVATALFDSAGGYAVSASVYSAEYGVVGTPTLNVAEINANAVLALDTITLPAPFDLAAFDLVLYVDPVSRTATALVTSGGTTFQTAPIALTNYGGHQNMTLGQLLGATNQYGPGDTTSAEFADFQIAAAVPIAIEIDVLPGDRENVINPRRELTPVAILSSRDFDATTIVPSSISLAGAPVGVSPRFGELCRMALVNRDRRPDLLCQVVTALIDVPIGRSTVTLKGTTQDGTPVEGHDSVRRVK